MKESDVVKLVKDFGKIKAGTEGVVVSIYADKKACEVEVWDDEKYPVDVITFSLDELEKVK